ncbi:hypothetical protein BsWGS_04063 [Bradybaena similaris]
MEVNVHPPDNITYNISSGSSSNNSSVVTHSQADDLGPPLYVYIYVTTINALVFFVGVIGNALVIHVVASVRSMRKRMNYFLVSLSVADLMVLLVALPTSLHEFYGKEKWYLGQAMCEYHLSTFRVSVPLTISMCNVTATIFLAFLFSEVSRVFLDTL